MGNGRNGIEEELREWDNEIMGNGMNWIEEELRK